MPEHHARIHWLRTSESFTDFCYHRTHTWSFADGFSVPASSSPLVVPEPQSSPDAINPEDAIVAAASSCHMLWFLHLAAQQHFLVDEYRDNATGVLKPGPHGAIAITTMTLRPTVTFAMGHAPHQSTFEAIHDLAHKRCYIANSLITTIECHPQMKNEC